MTTTTEAPASEKQIKFIQDLIADRETDGIDLALEMVTEKIEEGALHKGAASLAIDMLLKCPKRPKVKADAASSPWAAVQERFNAIPKSKYAIPSSELYLELDIADVDSPDNFRGDLVFVELKEYQSRRYMRQLHGAPGTFVRSKMSLDAVNAVVSIISRDPYKYAKLFGDNYTCCGSCGAALTDERSRELMLGPECRKKFGF